MAKLAKFLSSASGVGAGLDVDEVFNNYVYDGNSSTRTITNDIDLNGEGGLVWIKIRSAVTSHQLYDTERGATKYLISNSDSEELTDNTGLTAFNSNGFSLSSGVGVNGSTQSYVSWTFRKAPKFFDVQTWSGDSVNGRTISHNLGSTVGCIMIKRTDIAGGQTYNWTVWHKGYSPSNSDECGILDSNIDFRFAGLITNVTSTNFTVSDSARLNTSGGTYVAYIFAHNNGDGDFGPDGDQDIIKCGSYTGDGQVEGPNINLGFEPQWLLFKSSSHNENWFIVDNMREWNADGNCALVRPNLNNDEITFDGTSSGVRLNSTGFQMSNNSNDNNGSGKTYIYMAIRRGPLAVSTDAANVFDVTTWTSSGEPKFQTSFASDMAMNRNVNSSYDMRIASRLTQGTFLETSDDQSESTNSNFKFDYMNGFLVSGGSSDFYSWQWKRAPGYFDVVCYVGTGSARTVSHNLGVVPEMIWIKNRGYSAGEDWSVYHKGVNGGTDPENYILQLNKTNSQASSTDDFNDTAPTSTVFTVGSDRRTNALKELSFNNVYIAYLFATVVGVSKVGSYTGDGTEDGSKIIDCGFSSGARFVLIKRTDLPGAWQFFDSTRGIVAGNDPRLQLESPLPQETGYDFIDPHNSGFIVGVSTTSKNAFNVNNANYIFYAIAAS